MGQQEEKNRLDRYVRIIQHPIKVAEMKWIFAVAYHISDDEEVNNKLVQGHESKK